MRRLQPKGLLATEGAVTIPWRGSPYPVPALTSTFLEFIDDAGGARALRRAAAKARTIAWSSPRRAGSTATISATGCAAAVMSAGLPRLEFVGRAGVATDLVGEKLSRGFRRRGARHASAPAPCLAPRARPRRRSMNCWSTRRRARRSRRRRRWSSERLRANPQYAYARALGQLGPVRPRAVERSARPLCARRRRGAAAGSPTSSRRS